MPNTTEWDVELGNIERQRKYAELLRQQGMEPLKSETAGGMVVPIHPFQGLAKMLQAYSGRRGEEIATEQARDVTSRRNKALAETLRGSFEPVTVPGKEALRAYGEIVEPAVAPTSRSRTPQEISQALMANPDTMQIGGQMMIKNIENQGAGQRAREQALFEHQLKLDPAYIQAQKNISAAGRASSPYFSPAYDANRGMGQFDHRTGKYYFPSDRLVRPTDSPELQGKIAEEKKLGQEMGDQRAMLQGKQDALSSIVSARKILTDGIYTGAYADIKMQGAKLMPGVNTDKAARTEQFKSYIGNTVIPRLKEFGGNDSNEELRYLQKVMGGEIKSESAALEKILEDAEVKVRRGIARLQARESAPGAPVPGKNPTVDALLEKYK